MNDARRSQHHRFKHHVTDDGFLAVTATSYLLQGNEKRASRALVEGLCAALVVSALNDAHAPHP